MCNIQQHCMVRRKSGQTCRDGQVFVQYTALPERSGGEEESKTTRTSGGRRRGRVSRRRLGRRGEEESDWNETS